VEVVEYRSTADAVDVAGDEEVFGSLFEGWDDGRGD
jgi:hypothetical protein